MRTLAHSPAALEGYLSLSGALAGGRLGGRLREQVALAVADANACDYCLAAHSALGKAAGLSVDEIRAARGGEAEDPRATAALQFARAVLKGRGEVGDREFARVREAGFDDGQIAELVAEVALNVLTNYFNKAARVVVDFPRAEARSAVA
jgi:AhpD family alkylhydroperoxidase